MAVDRMRARRARSGGQGEREIDGFGNADVRTDEPVGAKPDLDRLARRPVGRERETGDEEGLVLIAVIHQVEIGDGLGQRPLHGSGLDPFRQGPCELRRRPAVARIAPVGVPALVDGLPETEAKALARHRRPEIGGKHRRHMLRPGERPGLAKRRRLSGSSMNEAETGQNNGEQTRHAQGSVSGCWRRRSDGADAAVCLHIPSSPQNSTIPRSTPITRRSAGGSGSAPAGKGPNRPDVGDGRLRRVTFPPSRSGPCP